MPQDLALAHETPRDAEYRALREAAGLSPKSEEAAARGLPNTVFSVTLRQEAALVGMGRVVGDGGLFLQIVDIAVRPEFQRRGWGKKIMAELMDWIKANMPASTYVSLIADDGAEHLYGQFGFVETAPKSVGMAFRIG